MDAAMNELDAFLTPTLARQDEAEQALISGDLGPRLAMTSGGTDERDVTSRALVTGAHLSVFPLLGRRLHLLSQGSPVIDTGKRAAWRVFRVQAQADVSVSNPRRVIVPQSVAPRACRTRPLRRQSMVSWR